MRYITRLLLVLLCFRLGLTADCVFDGHPLKIGESFQNPGQCAVYHCDSEGSLSAKTCAESVPPPNCAIIPQDNSKPYPDCCKRLEC